MEPEITHFGYFVQSQVLLGFLDYANLQMIH